MISQNRLRIIALKVAFYIYCLKKNTYKKRNFKLLFIIMKNDFSNTGKKYKEALRYYGYDNYSSLFAPNTNSVIYPMPVLKNSRTLTKQASLPRFFC